MWLGAGLTDWLMDRPDGRTSTAKELAASVKAP
jgi:hypothetical protein